MAETYQESQTAMDGEELSAGQNRPTDEDDTKSIASRIKDNHRRSRHNGAGTFSAKEYYKMIFNHSTGAQSVRARSKKNNPKEGRHRVAKDGSLRAGQKRQNNAKDVVPNPSERISSGRASSLTTPFTSPNGRQRTSAQQSRLTQQRRDVGAEDMGSVGQSGLLNDITSQDGASGIRSMSYESHSTENLTQQSNIRVEYLIIVSRKPKTIKKFWEDGNLRTPLEKVCRIITSCTGNEAFSRIKFTLTSDTFDLELSIARGDDAAYQNARCTMTSQIRRNLKLNPATRYYVIELEPCLSLQDVPMITDPEDVFEL